jgi:hypothetical protein
MLPSFDSYDESVAWFMSLPGHEAAYWSGSIFNWVFDYDPADDGPECEIATRILASHPLYTPGKEAELLRFQKFVNRVARHMYDNPYSRLSAKRKIMVAKEVIVLHVKGKHVPPGSFLWTR